MQLSSNGPSAGARCLLYWANLSRTVVDDDDDRMYCEACARAWSLAVIAGDSGPTWPPAMALDSLTCRDVMVDAFGDSGVA
jgi:hypothetical protein